MKFKKLLELVSFSTPKAIVFNLSAILFTFTALPTKHLEYLPFKCVFKHFLLPLLFNGDCPIDGIFANCECPACGMARGLSRLLHGDLESAWKLNKMVFILLPAMLFLIIYNVVKIIKKD